MSVSKHEPPSGYSAQDAVQAAQSFAPRYRILGLTSLADSRLGERFLAPPAGLRHLVAVPSLVAEAIGVFVVALALRLPFQTTTLYHWDSVLYARALAGFDVSEARPHPPGYLLYIATARLAQLFLHDPNASLVAVSIVSGALAVAAVYLVGRQLGGREIGIGAALLLCTANPFWYYSGVAYPYTLLAALSTALAGLSIAYWRGRWRSGAALGFLYGLAGGFRTDLLLFLPPLLIVAHVVRARQSPGWLHWFTPLLAAAVGIALWLLPTAWLSQGWDTYWLLLRLQGGYVEDSYSIWSRGWSALQSNGWQVIVYVWEALHVATFAVAYLVGRSIISGWRGAGGRLGWASAPAVLILALWILPPAAFYTFVHIGDRGYSFSLLPGMAVAAALGTWWLVRDLVDAARRAEFARAASTAARFLAAITPTQCYALLLAGFVTTNLALFCFGTSRLSAHEMRCVNQTMAQSLEIVRRHFNPSDTLLFSSFFYQHARYYLPEYAAWWFDPLTRPVYREDVPEQSRHVVIFGEGMWAARQPNVSYYPLECGRRLYYFFDVSPSARLVYRPPLLTILSPIEASAR